MLSDPVLLIVFALGLIFGSFANVVIHRLPIGKSVVRPRSACPKCGKPVVWYDNIPLFSWLWLRARCRFCQSAISIRYPFVELLTGALWAAAYWKFGMTFTAAEVMILTFGLIVVTFIDLDEMIIPDVFSLPGIVLGFAFSLLNPDRSWIDSLIGILLGGGFLWSIACIYYLITKKEGLGGGDIKLLAWIGAFLGWQCIPFVILCSSITGSLIGVMISLKSKDGLKAMIPFGPFIAFAAILYIYSGDLANIFYWEFFLPGVTK